MWCKTLRRRDLGRIEGCEPCPGKDSALLGQVAPDAIGRGVAVFFCDEWNSNTGKTKNLAGLYVAKQNVLPGVLGKIWKSDVLHVLSAAILRGNAAAPDGLRSTVKEKKGFLGGEGSIQNKRDRCRLPVGHASALRPCPEVDSHITGEAGPASFGVCNGLADVAAIQTVDEVKRSAEQDVEEERESDSSLEGVASLRDRECVELARSRALRDHGAEVFDESGTAELGSPAG